MGSEVESYKIVITQIKQIHYLSSEGVGEARAAVAEKLDRPVSYIILG